jgi:hypothetical protein
VCKHPVCFPAAAAAAAAAGVQIRGSIKALFPSILCCCVFAAAASYLLCVACFRC